MAFDYEVSPADQALARPPSQWLSRPYAVPSVVVGAMMLVALGACSTAETTDLASATATRTTPSEILVDVSPTRSSDNSDSRSARQVSEDLETALVKRLASAGVPAEPYVAGTYHRGSAVLSVSVAKADPGNAVRRFVIGFGSGKSDLQVVAELESTDDSHATSLAAFSTSSSSGRKPGLVVPGAVALGTGSLIGLGVGGGLDIVSNSRGAFHKPVNDTSNAIVSHLKQYYASTGWYWPTAS